jgi:protein-S-isoprenylcysteine O-methyltransferase Ste14
MNGPGIVSARMPKVGNPVSDQVMDASLANSVESPNGVESPAPQPSGPVVQVGRVKLRGPWAILTLLVVLSLFVALVVYSRPRVSILVSAAVWFLLDVYWSFAEVKRTAAKTRESSKSRQVHGLLTTASLMLLFVPVPGLTRQFVPDTLAMAIVGLGIQVGFALFYFWGRLHLGRWWSGQITIMNDHQLIQTGPYRLLRHPMYTGMLGMCVGTAIVSGQYHALLGIALVVLAYARKIRIEERVLRAEFGPAYESYRRNRAALIPWLI